MFSLIRAGIREEHRVGAEIDMKAFGAFVANNTLHITVEKEFDFNSLHQGWATFVKNNFPGPYAAVEIDMSKCGRVTSTFYAGLMQLNFAYQSQNGKPIRLLKPDPRTLMNLKILHLDKQLDIIP
jgi:hypothetical protein